jgi:hypothetical protein
MLCGQRAELAFQWVGGTMAMLLVDDPGRPSLRRKGLDKIDCFGSSEVMGGRFEHPRFRIKHDNGFQGGFSHCGYSSILVCVKVRLLPWKPCGSFKHGSEESELPIEPLEGSEGG